MRVDLSVETFGGAEALPDLLSLLRCFAEGRHDWVAGPAVVAAAERYLTEHAPRLAASSVGLARKGTVAAMWSGGCDRSAPVRVGPGDLADHAADLCRPAVLVVEDHLSDGCFVRALAEVFRAQRLRRALSQGWLEITHGGGSSLVKVAESVAGRYRRRVRAAALLDSDRLVPGQHTDSHRKAERLARAGVVVHVLELREAENYLPDRVLGRPNRSGGCARKVRLLARLTPEQRGHFDMKNGFGPPQHPPAFPIEQVILFGQLDSGTLVGLRGGFGRDLLRRLAGACAELTEEDFASVGPDVAGELRSLLATLTSVI
ncbi:MAG TPA: hypothetical protein VFX70_19795 [Mycobacteriales bacterium]|nr:hypothetical protein [Mycobacteriales bacterium]